MKFFHIAMVLFIFQLITAYLVTVLPSIGFSETMSFHEPTQSELESGWADYKGDITSDTTVTEDSWVNDLLGSPYEAVKQAITRIFTPFERYVNTLPFLMIIMGVPETFAWAISVPLYAIQVIGLLQFATGRSLKEIL